MGQDVAAMKRTSGRNDRVDNPTSAATPTGNAETLSCSSCLSLRADLASLKAELEWICKKLELPADTQMFTGQETIAGRLHVWGHRQAGYVRYIEAYKCDDKQGEIARLSVRLSEAEAELVALKAERDAPVVIGGDGSPNASCVLCGEMGPLAVWYAGTRHGVCNTCRGLRAELVALKAERAWQPFQDGVRDWAIACFGEIVVRDKSERVHRFIEEALELAQSLGCTRDEVFQLVDYVFDRPVGDPLQELGGAMTTLAALSFAHGFDMNAAGTTELARCWTKIETIRAKQAAKPKHSPLPEMPLPPPPASSERGKEQK